MKLNTKANRILAGCLFTCAISAIAWATPPLMFSLIPVVGPTAFDEIHTKAKTDTWECSIKTKGLSDVYMSEIVIAPGGHGGWHSHPGPSFLCVKSGTATFYDDCNDLTRQQYPAGTGFVEDANCVHFLANEGDEELVVVVMQIVEFGAPRRIDEQAP